MQTMATVVSSINEDVNINRGSIMPGTTFERDKSALSKLLCWIIICGLVRLVMVYLCRFDISLISKPLN